jgi:hypothetical protein
MFVGFNNKVADGQKHAEVYQINTFKINWKSNDIQKLLKIRVNQALAVVAQKAARL